MTSTAWATRAQISARAQALITLAPTYGLSQLRYGSDHGELVADVEPSRTYYDVARFESDAAALVGAAIRLIPATAPTVHAGPLLSEWSQDR